MGMGGCSLWSAKEVRHALIAAHAFFITLASCLEILFILIQSPPDLSISCRKCTAMGREHPGLLTRHLPSLLHRPHVGTELGRVVLGVPSPGTGRVSHFGALVPGPVPVCFTGARGRQGNQSPPLDLHSEEFVIYSKKYFIISFF